MSNYLYSLLSLKISEKGLLIRGSLVQAHPEAPNKESCKSMIYGTFLFLAFQSCTQFAPFFERCAHLHPQLCRILTKNSAKDNLCRALSSSNVDKLKTPMRFQPSTYKRRLYAMPDYFQFQYKFLTNNGYLCTQIRVNHKKMKEK